MKISVSVQNMLICMVVLSFSGCENKNNAQGNGYRRIEGINGLSDSYVHIFRNDGTALALVVSRKYSLLESKNTGGNTLVAVFGVNSIEQAKDYDKISFLINFSSAEVSSLDGGNFSTMNSDEVTNERGFKKVWQIRGR